MEEYACVWHTMSRHCYEISIEMQGSKHRLRGWGDWSVSALKEREPADHHKHNRCFCYSQAAAALSRIYSQNPINERVTEVQSLDKNPGKASSLNVLLNVNCTFNFSLIKNTSDLVFADKHV